MKISRNFLARKKLNNRAAATPLNDEHARKYESECCLLNPPPWKKIINDPPVSNEAKMWFVYNTVPMLVMNF